jgi:hypothetical protein
MPCRTPCRLFVHELFLGPLGLHLLVWNELGRSPPFQPTRALTLPWSGAFNLVCEVALTRGVEAFRIWRHLYTKYWLGSKREEALTWPRKSSLAFHFGSIQFSSLRRCWIFCVVHYDKNFTSSKCEIKVMALTPSCKGLWVDLGLDQSCTRIYTC